MLSVGTQCSPGGPGRQGSRSDAALTPEAHSARHTRRIREALSARVVASGWDRLVGTGMSQDEYAYSTRSSGRAE